MTDIFSLLAEREAQAVRNSRKGVIVNPGAIGDCLLTLPLAHFMKETLGLGSIDFIGHTDYISFYPGRTCIDTIRSIESVDLHRLFAGPGQFRIEDQDPLIGAFSGYEWVVCLLGKPHSTFEENLILTVNCSHSAEVAVLPFAPAQDSCKHISLHYVHSLLSDYGGETINSEMNLSRVLLTPMKSDIAFARDYLETVGMDSTSRTAMIHPGSGGSHKCWHLQNFLALAEGLAEDGVQILFLIGPAEMERLTHGQVQAIADVGVCIAEMELNDVVKLFSVANLYIGNDSGITHIASAMGIPTVAIFGPSDAIRYRPLGPLVEVIRQSESAFARPCTEGCNRVRNAIGQLWKD